MAESNEKNVESENENKTTDTATKKTTTSNTDVVLTKERNATPGLNEIADASRFLIRGVENGIINETTGSSVVLRQNGQINLASSKYSQYKLNPSGKIVEESLESVTITNRKKYSADDIVVNEHKLNPFLYELTDMKELSNHYNDKMLVGNFCMFGTVLVKAWEPELKRYVLIRRLARMPMFSPLLNVPEINPGLDISDPLKVDHHILAKSDKGYQVNKPLKDKNSLIGKQGVSRFGTGGSGNGGAMANIGTISGGDNEEKVWNALMAAGFTANGAAGLMGNFQQECGFNIDLTEGGGNDFSINDGNGYGLAQWTTPGRKQGLLDTANSMGLKVSDIRAQLNWLMVEMNDREVYSHCVAVDETGSCPACPKYAGQNLLTVCKNASSYVESAILFHDMFEISADYEAFGSIDHRIEYARQFLEKFGGGKK